FEGRAARRRRMQLLPDHRQGGGWKRVAVGVQEAILLEILVERPTLLPRQKTEKEDLVAVVLGVDSADAKEAPPAGREVAHLAAEGLGGRLEKRDLVLHGAFARVDLSDPQTRDREAREDADDRDDHEHLDQGEGADRSRYRSRATLHSSHLESDPRRASR